MSSDSQAPSFPGVGPRLLRVAGIREIFAIDLRTLALFRIGLGGLLIADLLLRARDLSAHYTDFGILPRVALVNVLHPGAFSLHLLNDGFAFQALLFVIAGVFALMLLAGYRTRLATVVSWLMLLSLQNRNPMILSGEDNLIVLLAFWAMFLPLGARFSVDAALDNARCPTANRYFSVATVALLIQGMAVYFFSALLKSDAQWIPDGTAVYYALQLDYLVTPFALWFRQFGDLLQGLTYGVWAVELIGPFLIFSPLFHRQLRGLFQLVFITMHIGFFLCLEIGLFPFVGILMNLTFTQGWVWDRLVAVTRRNGGRGFAIYYDEGCDFCLKICRLLRTFLILPEVRIAPAQSDPGAWTLLEAHDSWVVRDGSGKDHLRWDAMLALLAASPLAFLLGRCLSPRPLQRLGERFYGLVADHRGQLSRITARLLPFRPIEVGPGLVGSATAGVLLGFVLLQNLTTLPSIPYGMPGELVTLRQTLGLYQFWTMFAPHPEMNSPWPVIVGRLRDGTLVDVYNRRAAAPDWEKPVYVSKTYANYRWRRYLSNIEDMSYEGQPPDYGLNYGRYLCRLWNRDAVAAKQLTNFKIYFQVEWTEPDYRPKQPLTRHIWTHRCFG